MRVTILTNLFPSSRFPSRAVFNQQKFEALSRLHKLQLLVPVPWKEWVREGCPEPITEFAEEIVYFPYYYPPGFGRRWYGDMLFAAVRKRKTIVESFQPDLIYGSFLFPDGYAAARLASELRLPCVAGLHGTDVNVHMSHASRAKRIMGALNRTNHTISVSEALTQKLLAAGVAQERITTIYNGVNTQLFRPQPQADARSRLGLSGKKVVVYIGNLLRSKGVLDLASAAEQLDPDTTIHFIGRGAEQALLTQKANSAMGGAPLELAGVRPHAELPLWIAAADVVCLPSYREGVPNVVLEAIACGRPVVATDVGGIPEVTAEANALLVTPGDIDGLARSLRAALAQSWNPELIVSSGRVASWTEVASRISTILLQAANEGPLA